MDSNKAYIVQFISMYNYSQVVMKQNIYCLNYFKKIKNVQACYNCLETGFKTAIGIIQVWATFKKVIKLLPLLEALIIVFTLVNLSSTRVHPNILEQYWLLMYREPESL